MPLQRPSLAVRLPWERMKEFAGVQPPQRRRPRRGIRYRRCRRRDCDDRIYGRPRRPLPGPRPTWVVRSDSWPMTRSVPPASPLGVHVSGRPSLTAADPDRQTQASQRSVDRRDVRCPPAPDTLVEPIDRRGVPALTVAASASGDFVSTQEGPPLTRGTRWSVVGVISAENRRPHHRHRSPSRTSIADSRSARPVARWCLSGRSGNCCGTTTTSPRRDRVRVRSDAVARSGPGGWRDRPARPRAARPGCRPGWWVRSQRRGRWPNRWNAVRQNGSRDAEDPVRPVPPVIRSWAGSVRGGLDGTGDIAVGQQRADCRHIGPGHGRADPVRPTGECKVGQ